MLPIIAYGQYYTLEEQVHKLLTHALKFNQQRHCFIQLLGQETQPLLIPFVKDFYVSNENMTRYVDAKARAAKAITPQEADEKISQSVADLLLLRDTATENDSEESFEIADPLSPKTTASHKKRTLFDRIKEANPDLDLNG